MNRGPTILRLAPIVWGGAGKVFYSQVSTATPTLHRADCSGFYCACAGLPAPGLSTVTLVTENWIVPIGWPEIRPGDAIGLCGPGTEGDNGHIMIFDSRNPDGSWNVWEQSGGMWGPHRSTYSDAYIKGFAPYRAISDLLIGGENMATVVQDAAGTGFYVLGSDGVARQITGDINDFGYVAAGRWSAKGDGGPHAGLLPYDNALLDHAPWLAIPVVPVSVLAVKTQSPAALDYDALAKALLKVVAGGSV